MIVPSLSTWLVGSAIVVLSSALLWYLTDEAYELASWRRRASVPAEDPKGTPVLEEAA